MESQIIDTIQVGKSSLRIWVHGEFPDTITVHVDNSPWSTLFNLTAKQHKELVEAMDKAWDLVIEGDQ